VYYVRLALYYFILFVFVTFSIIALFRSRKMSIWNWRTRVWTLKVRDLLFVMETLTFCKWCLSKSNRWSLVKLAIVNKRVRCNSRFSTNSWVIIVTVCSRQIKMRAGCCREATPRTGNNSRILSSGVSECEQKKKYLLQILIPAVYNRQQPRFYNAQRVSIFATSKCALFTLDLIRGKHAKNKHTEGPPICTI